MLISMWVIKDIIGDRVLEVHITEGSTTIRNVSLLSQARATLKRTAYICPSEQFISTMRNRVICVHGIDWIVIDSDDFEEVFDLVSSRIEELFDWDLDVRNQIARACPLSFVAERATEILGSVASVVNPSFFMEAHGPLESSAVPQELAKRILEDGSLSLGEAVEFSKDYVLFSSSKGLFTYYLERYGGVGTLCKSLFIEGMYWGVCMLYIGNRTFGQVSQGTQQLFEVYHDHVSLWLTSHETIGRTTPHAHMVRAMTEKPSQLSAREARNYLEGLGWDEDCAKFVVLLEYPDSNPSMHHITSRRLDGLHPKVTYASRDDMFTVIVNSDEITPDALFAGMRPMMERVIVRAGVSFPFRNETHISNAYREASMALSHTPFDGGACFCQENALPLLRDLLDSELATCLRHPAINDIERYDAEHSSSFLQTLHCYLKNERSLVRTAAAMHVHKNTVKYRIQTLEERFDLDLNDEEQRTHLLVSLSLGL